MGRMGAGGCKVGQDGEAFGAVEVGSRYDGAPGGTYRFVKVVSIEVVNR